MDPEQTPDVPADADQRPTAPLPPTPAAPRPGDPALNAPAPGGPALGATRPEGGAAGYAPAGWPVGVPAEASARPAQRYPAPIGWVIAAVILFWPTAIPALLASHRSARAAGAGDVVTADREAASAKRWGVISVAVGAALVVLAVVASIVWAIVVAVVVHDHRGDGWPHRAAASNVAPFGRAEGGSQAAPGGGSGFQAPGRQEMNGFGNGSGSNGSGSNGSGSNGSGTHQGGSGRSGFGFGPRDTAPSGSATPSPTTGSIG